MCFLSGCSHLERPKTSEDSKYWLKMYEKEIMIAIENNDRDAWRFFGQEYIKEYKRIKQESKIK